MCVLPANLVERDSKQSNKLVPHFFGNKALKDLNVEIFKKYVVIDFCGPSQIIVIWRMRLTSHYFIAS